MLRAGGVLGGGGLTSMRVVWAPLLSNVSLPTRLCWSFASTGHGLGLFHQVPVKGAWSVAATATIA